MAVDTRWRQDPYIEGIVKCATRRRRRFWSWFVGLLYGVILFTALTAMMVAFLVSRAHSHSTQITGCTNNILYTEAVKVGEDRVDHFLSAVYESYDTNNDGERDIVALSHITNVSGPQDAPIVEHDPYPYMYLVDVDYDGYPDKSYVDRKGVGDCNDIHFYKDLRTFGAPSDFDDKEEGVL